MGSSKRQVIGYKYYVGAHLVLGHGPFDRITRIAVGDKVAWTALTDKEGRGDPNGYERVNINAPDLFGGKSSEGGIQGAVDIGMGYPNQPVNDYLRARLANIGNVPAYRDLVSVILRQVYVGMSPYLKNWTFRAQRIWAPIEGKQQWLPPIAGIGEKNTRVIHHLDGLLGKAVWLNNQLWLFSQGPTKGTSVTVYCQDYLQGTQTSRILAMPAPMCFWPMVTDAKVIGTKIMWPLCANRDDKLCVMEFDTATWTWEEFLYPVGLDFPGWGRTIQQRYGIISNQLSCHWWQPLGEAYPLLTIIGPPGFGYTLRPYERTWIKLPTLGVVDWSWHPTAFHVLATDIFVEPVFNQHIACALLQKQVIVNDRYINRFALHWINLDTGLPGNSDDIIPSWVDGWTGAWADDHGEFSMKVVWPFAYICVPQIMAEVSTASSRFWVVNIEQLQVLPKIGFHDFGLPKIKTVGTAVGGMNMITAMVMDPAGKIQCINTSDVYPGYVLTLGSGKYDMPTAEFHADTYSGMYAWDYRIGSPTPTIVARQKYGAPDGVIETTYMAWAYARERWDYYTAARAHYSSRSHLVAFRDGSPLIVTSHDQLRIEELDVDGPAEGILAQPLGWSLYEPGKTLRDMKAVGWLGSTATYFFEPGGAAVMRVKNVSGGNWDMNPAHIIRECMTNRTWGRGLPESLIGPTFAQAAAQLYNEGLGMSLLWTAEIAVDEFIAEILRTIDAIRYENPETGQQEIKLIRGGYDAEYIASLPVIGPDNSTSEQVVKPPVYELINQVTVTYWNRSTGEDGCVTVQDTAAINQVGSVNAQAMQYVGITRGDNALAVATRDLGSLSKPFAKGKLTTNRRVANLIPGDLFVLNDPASGIEQMVCRVGRRIDNGALDGRIGIEWGQDVFGTVYTTTATPPDSGWVDPVPAPINFTFSGAFEVPYPMVVQDVGDTTASRLPDDIAYLGFAGARPSTGVLLDYELWDYAEGDTNQGIGTVAVFTPIAQNGSTLQGLGVTTVGAPTATLMMPGNSAADMDQVQAGDMALVWRNGYGPVEWIEAIGAPVYSESLNQYSVDIKRAVAGSVPATWSPDDRIFWVGSIYGASRDEWTDGMSVSAFGRPKNSKGSYQGTPTIHTVHMAGWAGRPYAAANVRVNEYYVAPDDGQLDVEITWARRNRLSQSHNGVSWYDPTDYPPEEGTRYVLTIQGRDAAGAAIGDPVVRDLGSVTSYKLDRSADVPAEAKSVHLSLVTERNGLAAVLSSSFDVKLRAVLTAPFRVFSRYDSEYVPPVTKLMPYDVHADVFWEKLGLVKPTDFIADYVPTVIEAPVDLVADYDDHLDAPTRVSIAYSTKLDAPSRVFAVYSAGPKPLSAPVELVADFIPTVISAPVDLIADFEPTVIHQPLDVVADYDGALDAPTHVRVTYVPSASLAAPIDLVADFEPTVIHQPVDLIADYDGALDAPTRVSIAYSTLLDAPTNVKVVYVSVKVLDAPVDLVADFEPTVIHQPSDVVADYDESLDAPTRVSVAYSTKLDAPSRVMVTYKGDGPALAAPIDLLADYIPSVISKVVDLVADFEPTVIYRPADVIADYDGALDAPFRVGVTYSTRLDAPSHVKARYAAALASPVDVVTDFEPTVIRQPGDVVADYDPALDAPVLRGITYRTALAAPTAIRIQYK